MNSVCGKRKAEEIVADAKRFNIALNSSNGSPRSWETLCRMIGKTQKKFKEEVLDKKNKDDGEFDDEDNDDVFYEASELAQNERHITKDDLRLLNDLYTEVEQTYTSLKSLLGELHEMKEIENEFAHLTDKMRNLENQKLVSNDSLARFVTDCSALMRQTVRYEFLAFFVLQHIHQLENLRNSVDVNQQVQIDETINYIKGLWLKLDRGKSQWRNITGEISLLWAIRGHNYLPVPTTPARVVQSAPPPPAPSRRAQMYTERVVQRAPPPPAPSGRAQMYSNPPATTQVVQRAPPPAPSRRAQMYSNPPATTQVVQRAPATTQVVQRAQTYSNTPPNYINPNVDPSVAEAIRAGMPNVPSFFQRIFN